MAAVEQAESLFHELTDEPYTARRSESSGWTFLNQPPAPPEVPKAVSFKGPYGELAQNLLARFGTDGPQATAIITPEVGLDASAIVVGLASQLAQDEQHRVLIVHRACHQSAQLDQLGIPQKPGLVDFLFDPSRDADWSDVIQTTNRTQVDWLPFGTTATDAGHDLGRIDWAQVWGDLKSRYAHVLLDAGCAVEPPIQRLAGCCDGVLLVVQLDRTDPSAARLALESFRKPEGPVLGAIVVTRPEASRVS